MLLYEYQIYFHKWSISLCLMANCEMMAHAITEQLLPVMALLRL